MKCSCFLRIACESRKSRRRIAGESQKSRRRIAEESHKSRWQIAEESPESRRGRTHLQPVTYVHCRYILKATTVIFYPFLFIINILCKFCQLKSRLQPFFLPYIVSCFWLETNFVLTERQPKMMTLNRPELRRTDWSAAQIERLSARPVCLSECRSICFLVRGSLCVSHWWQTKCC